MASPPPLFDNRGKPVSLGKEIGKGGEGSVFEIQGIAQAVAKIYSKALDRTKQAKLQTMVAMAKDELSKVAAWPQTTLHSAPGGGIVGIAMPRITGFKEVHTLYSPAQRKLQFPQADWNFLIIAANNCAQIFDVFHRNGIVIGDVNQSNALVSNQCHIRWIDCDSIQIDYSGNRFFCDVAVPLFTPPELQNSKTFKGISRTPNHDNFGLAILIFQLLFMGRHPYIGKFSGRGDMPADKAISEHRFAYSLRQAKRTEMSPPPASIVLSHVSPELAALFERAFAPESVSGGRPIAREWATALMTFSRSLKPCKTDPGHLVPPHLSSCPWCALMGTGAPNFFISVTAYKLTSQQMQSTFVLAVVWQQIDTTGFPWMAYQRPPSPSCQPRPLPSGMKADVPPLYVEPTPPEQITMQWAAVGAGIVTFLFWILLSWKVAIVPFLGLVSLGGLWIHFEAQRRKREEPTNRYRSQVIAFLKQEGGKRQGIEHDAKRRLESLESNWIGHAQRRYQEFRAKHQTLKKAKDDLESVPTLYETERQHLLKQAQQMQLTAFLQSKFIDDATIPDIGPVLKASLASNGIETAHDIDYRINNIPNFGPKRTSRLTVWRSQVEKQFRFDPAKGIPEPTLKALNMKYFQIKQGLEAQLTTGVAEIKTIRLTADQELGMVRNQILQAIQVLAQAATDLSIIPFDRLR